MSIPVEPDRLQEETTRHVGPVYLLTAGGDGRPHAVSSGVHWQEDRLVAPAGKRSRSNVAANPLVSFLWPPSEPGGYSLIVDADAVVDGDNVVARPTRGVLHRPGRSASDRPSCSSDCVPLLDP